MGTRASMTALVDGGYLRASDEPIGLINAAMIATLPVFCLRAASCRGEGGRPLDVMPDVSNWFTNEFLSQSD
ncbi:hypothetical protein [Sulfitobacter sp. M13]